MSLFHSLRSLLGSHKAPPGYQVLRSSSLPEPVQWSVHASGRRFLTVRGGEIGMGGPETFVHHFDNGVTLADGGLFISDDGRHAAATGVRESCAITLFDFETGRCREWTDCADAHLLRGKRGPAHPQLLKHLQGDAAQQWRRMHGIWLPPDVESAPAQITLRAPGGSHLLQLQALIDEAQLRQMPDAWRYLQQPLYQLALDGVPLPVQTRSPELIRWSPDGDRLLVPAAGVSPEGSHWLWTEEGGGAWLTPGWNAGGALRSSLLTGVVSIDHDGLAMGIEVGVPSGGGYPNDWHVLSSPDAFTYGKYPDTHVEADEHARIRSVPSSPREESLVVRLTWREASDPQAAGVVESVSARGARAVFERVASGGGDSLSAWRVRVGAATADNVCLFHLWSACGRYLVLQPHSNSAPDRFFALDTSTGARFEGPWRASNLQLQRCEENHVQLQAPIASVDRDHGFGHFETQSSIAQPDARGVTRASGDRWLLMRSERFRFDPDAQQMLGPLPKSVPIDRPPFPTAAFGFVYPSPDRQRWVRCFGARDRFNDAWERAQEARYQACIVTDNGICLEGLGTAMIWCTDSRHLFVTPAHLARSGQSCGSGVARIRDRL